MKRLFLAIIGVFAWNAFSQNAVNLTGNESEFKKWSNRSADVKFLPNGGPDGKAAFAIDSKKNSVISYNLPVSRYRNKWVVMTGKIKAENIAKAPNPYLGVKFMINGSEGRIVRFGSYDWTTAASVVYVPEDAKKMIVHIGIQETTGKALFSDLSISSCKQPGGENLLPPVEVMKAMICGHGEFLPNGGPNKEYALSFINKNKDWNMISFPIPAKKVRGHNILFSAQVKGEGISCNNFWGPFLKISYIDASGKEKSFEAKYPNKTDFDWKDIDKEILVPGDAKRVSASIGLLKINGTAKFADLTLKLDD